MNVLHLKDPAIQRLRRTHRLLAGRKVLARGAFGAVFETGDPTRVVKLTLDQAHRDYLCDRLAPEGVYKPRAEEVDEELGETSEGDPIFLLEMERLVPLPRGSANRRLAWRIQRYAELNHRCPEESFKDCELPLALLRFMSQLNWFLDNFFYKPDLGLRNFMQRPDGSFVFSDPVFDGKHMERVWSRRRWAH